MKLLIPTFGAVLALTACSSAPKTIEIADGEQNLGPSTMSATVNRATNTVDLTINGTTYSGLTEQPFTVASDFDFYSGRGNAFYGVKETTNSKVAFGFLNPSNAGVQGSGASFANLVEGEIKQSGTATYSGEYVGIIGQGQQQPFTQLSIFTAGDVTVNANFEDAEISGAVTNRVSVTGSTSITLSDITMHTATIDKEGRFSGTVSGGEFTSDTFTPSSSTSGTYQGTLAGENAEEVVGITDFGYQITDGTSTLDMLELGAFQAEQ